MGRQRNVSCPVRSLSHFPEIYCDIMASGIVGGGVQLGPLGTAAANGLLCQPREIMMMEELVE
jgi:hypothetical protein